MSNMKSTCWFRSTEPFLQFQHSCLWGIPFYFRIQFISVDNQLIVFFIYKPRVSNVQLTHFSPVSLHSYCDILCDVGILIHSQISPCIFFKIYTNKIQMCLCNRVMKSPSKTYSQTIQNKF